MRFGVIGSLSNMISVMANTLRIITAGSDPTKDSGRASVSQPRYTAHATAAGGVSDRNPAKSPIRNANNSVMGVDYIVVIAKKTLGEVIQWRFAQKVIWLSRCGFAAGCEIPSWRARAILKLERCKRRLRRRM